MDKPLEQDQAGQRPDGVTLPLRAPGIGAPFYSELKRVPDRRETAQQKFRQVTLRPVEQDAAVASDPPAPEKSR